MEDNITRAIYALHSGVNNSDLDINCKQTLNVLLDKLAIYYEKRYQKIAKKHNNNIELIHLNSALTDYIVAINNAIKEKNDVFQITSMINKEIDTLDRKRYFKIK